jgi:hypothetical protein
VAGVSKTCAGVKPPARIADCARMKSTSVHNRRSWIKPHAVFGVYHNRVFCTDALFIRTENTVGARRAQVCSSYASIIKTPHMISMSVLKADDHE